MTTQRARQILGKRVEHLNDEQVERLILETKATIFVIYEQINRGVLTSKN